jgi:RsiW-degrading membrane proteinase PrsW (M82 family)
VTITSSAQTTSAAQRSARGRPSLWWSSLWAFVGLLAFIGIFNFLLPDLGSNLEEGGLIVLGFIFSLAPALLWLIIFYRVDAREPEPKRLVALVYGVGLLLAAALYQAVVIGFFDVESWMYSEWWSQLFGEILIIGALSMGIVYATVRFIVFGNPEFDERLDGIIYAMAAGLGVATIVNFAYVMQHGGVDLGIGSIRMVTNALGYASFAGVLGYFMGQARFEKTPAYYLPVGVALAAILNGFYFFLLDRTGSGQLGPNPWRDLLLAAFMAFVTLAVVGWLVNRSNEETLRVARLSAAGDAWEPLPLTSAIAANPPPPPAAEAPATPVAELDSAVSPQDEKEGA